MEPVLGGVKKGVSCVVKSVECEAAYRRRLYDLGLLPGTRVTVAGRAPFGGPVTVCLRGYYLSIGMREAGHIFLE